jgi:hypothetical protein
MSTPGYFNGMIYYQGMNDDLKAFAIADAHITPSPVSRTNRVINQRAGTPSVSANGTKDGIVWTLDVHASNAVLYAYDANNLASELYNTQRAPGGRDTLEGSVKFTVPTIANGFVYVGTSSSLDVLGLLGTRPNHRETPARPSVVAAASMLTHGQTVARPISSVDVLPQEQRPASTPSDGGNSVNGSKAQNETVFNRARPITAPANDGLDQVFRLWDRLEEMLKYD